MSLNNIPNPLNLCDLFKKYSAVLRAIFTRRNVSASPIVVAFCLLVYSVGTAAFWWCADAYELYTLAVHQPSEINGDICARIFDEVHQHR